MTELSDKVPLSQRGGTRLVDRMVQAGLVKRERCASDRRGTFATLTPVGRARLRDAQPVHLRGIRRHLAKRLSPAQLAAVAVAHYPLARTKPPAPRRPGCLMSASCRTVLHASLGYSCHPDT